jgi:hypothetical protein
MHSISPHKQHTENRRLVIQPGVYMQAYDT